MNDRRCFPFISVPENKEPTKRVTKWGTYFVVISNNIERQSLSKSSIWTMETLVIHPQEKLSTFREVEWLLLWETPSLNQGQTSFPYHGRIHLLRMPLPSSSLQVNPLISILLQTAKAPWTHRESSQRCGSAREKRKENLLTLEAVRGAVGMPPGFHVFMQLHPLWRKFGVFCVYFGEFRLCMGVEPKNVFEGTSLDSQHDHHDCTFTHEQTTHTGMEQTAGIALPVDHSFLVRHKLWNTPPSHSLTQSNY